MSEQDQEKDQQEMGRVARFWNDVRLAFNKYLERCSLNGVSFVRESNNKVVKIMWLLLFLGASVAMVFQLTELGLNFAEYSTYTEVKHRFNPLPLPAVTFCNSNPIRKSMLIEAGFHLRLLVASLDPEYLMSLNETKPSNFTFNTFSAAMNTRFHQVADYIDNIMKTSNLESTQEMNDTRKQGAESDLQSSFTRLLWNYRSKYVDEPVDKRLDMGHQLEDMVVMCSYGDHNCLKANFSLKSTTVYGNCFTLELDDKYRSQRSGPSEGISLVLWAQMDEYIHQLSEGKGFQVVIHDKGTVPFPGDDGMALSVGTESLIGIRQVVIKRLPHPFSSCVPVPQTYGKNGVKITSGTCMRIVEQKEIIRSCGCYDPFRQIINFLLNNSSGSTACMTRKELNCVRSVENRFSNTSVSMCSNACRGKKFEKTVSTRQWPNPAYADLMVMALCERPVPAKVCDRLRNKTVEEKRDEFIKIRIYFEDLNYEVYTDYQDYELSNLLSDIGGTIGLWIGLSILGMCEVIHLIFDLFICVKSVITGRPRLQRKHILINSQ